MKQINFKKTLTTLWFKLLDAFVDERYQEKRAYMKHCRDDPADLEHRDYWSTELHTLEKWRLLNTGAPHIISFFALIISLIALVVTIYS
jgi:hypothetical protein